MMNNTAHISTYDFSPDDDLFLDANVWLFIYGPQRLNDKRTRIYSDAFKRILTMRSRIHIDVLIISEFTNRYSRMKWKMTAPEGVRYKEFRKSDDFKSVASEIAAVLRNMLAVCSPVNDSRSTLDIGELIDGYLTGNFDFNDQVISALCRSNGWKLVTDDSDFSDPELFIVTANRQLCSVC